MRLFGLIGFPLSHSFSQKYFSEKFLKEGIVDAQYNNYPIESIDMFPKLWEDNPELVGLNVTIPYKEKVIPFLHSLDESAKRIGAVNVIKKMPDGTLKGYNSDYSGFKNSLLKFLDNHQVAKAYILGTGGAAKAVQCALEDIGVKYTYVSRTAGNGKIAYEDITKTSLLDHKLIIHSSPLGMYPNVDACPNIPYEYMDGSFYLYDLIYNPEVTLFMKNGMDKGAKAMNGLPMLIGQAEKAWEIWNAK
ncbi:MAG: shikimate dehydrogenase [Cytophagaceae bacterium]